MSAAPSTRALAALPVASSASPSRALAAPIDFGETALAVLKMSARCKALRDDEFALYIEHCKRRQLDPFVGQVHAIVRTSQRTGERTLTFQTGIDGFRTIAERTGRYEGQLGPFWCGADGVWKDVWLDAKPPAAAKVGILKKGWKEPTWGVARFASFYQSGGAGLWDRMPEGQIAKCAEAQGFRRAFPEDFGGIYVADEMDQAGVPVVEAEGVEVPAADGSGPASVVDRDSKPENIVVPPAPVPPVHPKGELFAVEAPVIERFAPIFAAVKTQPELDKAAADVGAELIRVNGGRNKSSPRALAWFAEAYQQAKAAIGAAARPTTAKAGAR
ncbi:MAG TPA: phage recombination protein Bet [Polyangiaceae bacterium]